MQNGDYAKEIFKQLAELKEGQSELRQRFDAVLDLGKHMASTTELTAAMMRETLARVDRVDVFNDRLDRRISRLENVERTGKPRDETPE
ncbi:MAG: hypothetical protein ACR2PI_23365 [Hyphomicrobiaceae bacterium]